MARPDLVAAALEAGHAGFAVLIACAFNYDPRRRIEVILDPAVLPLAWDPTWNQWKHLAGVRIKLDGTFVVGGEYRLFAEQWKLVSRLCGLPSRIQISLPANAGEQTRLSFVVPVFSRSAGLAYLRDIDNP